MSVSERLMKITHFKDKCFTHAVHGFLVGDDGNLYIDFFADVGTSSLGYASPEQTAVLQKMIDELQPVHAPNLFGYKSRNEAADRLCRITEMDKVFFCNSGAEAVEGAMKLARLYQFRKEDPECKTEEAWKSDIYTYHDGFHGRTLATLAAGGPAPHYHRDGYRPLPTGFYHFKTLKDLERLDSIAAVMLAPVFGNNDVRVYDRAFLQDLRQYCDATGALLIFDEVQTGSGRTGAPTYAQKVGVKPDIITLAKGIGMGAPVGAVLAQGPCADAFTPGTHWSTFGGNPLSVAFVNGMLDYLEAPGRFEAINTTGAHMKAILSQFGWAKNIRGEGMLIAFDIDKDSLQFAANCLEQRLIVGAFRAGPGPVKITPPLNTSELTIDRGLAILDAAYKAIG